MAFVLLTRLMHKEIEIKLDLQSAENYDLLLDKLGPPVGRSDHVNHFFDTADFALLKSGWALRLRIDNEHCTLTLKGPGQGEKGGLSIRAEYEAAYDCGQLDQTITGGLSPDTCPGLIRKQLEYMDITETMTRILVFQNERVAVKPQALAGDKKVMLDRTTFPDRSVDHELEMELDRPDEFGVAFELLKGLLKEHGVPVKIMKDSKFARALKRTKLEHLYRET